jgi:hypothetical protein
MTVLDRVPLETINTRAREVHFGRTLLTIIAAVLYAVGWLAAKTLGGLWLALAWSAVAVKVGWTEARAGAGTRGPA